MERVSGNAIVPNVTDLMFSLADGSAILPITMGDALKAVLSPYTAFDDWVIIRAPLTNKNLAKFDLNERVLAFAEAAAIKTVVQDGAIQLRGHQHHAFDALGG